ncbi:MAG: hypothetical protein JHC31_08225 [Sulfurihydrogenibium sp.]|nr:hypothetical protein [Sulfurihydrogenibium sp.]
MQNDIELLNNMLLQSLRKEIENIGDGAIYIPVMIITYSVKIEREVDVSIEKIEPESEYKIFIEYVAEALGESLKENMENSLRKHYYKIIKEQQYIPPHLKMLQELDTIIIDKNKMTIGSVKGTLYPPKKIYKLPPAIVEAIKQFAYDIPSTIEGAMKKLVGER